jgi:signal transduction histidine kinase
MSVREDRNGSLWIGTWGGGLNRLKDEKVRAFTTTNGFPDALVLSTCEARDGSLWIGLDFDGGIARLKDGKFTHYTWKDGLIGAAVRVMHEDRLGRLWIGTSGGLSCFKEGKFTNYTVKDHLAGNTVRTIYEDQEGNLWFGTEGGLSRWNHGQFTNFTRNEGLSDNSVIALYEDKGKNLWMGTANGGLNRYRDGKFTACTSKQGLFSDEILEILEDDNGWLWMTCSKGIFRVRKKDLDSLDAGDTDVIASIAYGKSDGMESIHCNGFAKPAAWKAHDGRLWFATSKGLAVVNPATTKINSVAPPVYVEEVVADKKQIQSLLGRAGSEVRGQVDPLWTARFGNRTLRIPPGRGELEFHYTALNFQLPEGSRFRYKLEGVDSEWIEAGGRRVAYYSHVSPGSYRFRVAASNKDGVWNDKGASLDLELQPHLWQIWWLRALAIVLVVGAASGSARYITWKRWQRRLELLEQRHAIEKERGRIAKDIHDDLGSSLTRIMMLGERVEEGLDKREDVGIHLDKMVSSARHTVQSLDEIVWAVNPENDSVQGLVEYISHYADEFFEDTEVLCHLEIPVELPDSALPAEIRHDLFLVVKEAFHNIMKHAHASEVGVQVSQTPSTIEIEIADNGDGFDPNKSPNGGGGNGLRNMRKRIETIGGQFSLSSAPGQGTKVKVSAPLKAPRSTV